MKVNDLRIGNYITSKTWYGCHKIDGIELIDDEVFEVKTKGYVHRYEQGKWFEIAPIQVTEDILLKCGFSKIPHFTVTNSLILDIGRGRFLSVGNVDDANQMVWLQSISGDKVTDLICVHNYDYDGLLYLHQLQNLHFALTGKELKINFKASE